VTADQYKSERQRRGTQQGVAALLGVDYRTIQRRESGEIAITVEAALAIRALPVRRSAGRRRQA
jgi:transcriptional regulator with XRE-family HTH domain